MADIEHVAKAAKLSIMRCAATGVAVMGVIFVVCWLGASYNLPGGSHMFVGIFTAAPPASSAALWAGLCWSLFFGAAIGGLTAIFYNLFAPWSRL
jgi:hypothetical protein